MIPRFAAPGVVGELFSIDPLLAVPTNTWTTEAALNPLPLIPLIAALVSPLAPNPSRAPAGDSLLVSVAWLAAHQNDPDLVILDFSPERAAYDQGHIPGAVWVDRKAIWRPDPPSVELPSVAAIDSAIEALGISNSSRVVIYGSTWIAPRVFLALEYVGHARAAMLDGGLVAWKKAGHPVSTDPVRKESGNFTPRPRPDIVVDAAWIDANRADGKVALLDGRSAGEYDGTDKSEQLPRAGHIPRAINIPWERTFTDEAGALQGTPSPLRSSEELRNLLTQAGITADRDIVTYCTVGLRAAHWYFVARYLGLSPKIYDGSMRDWSPRTELPVEAK